jgi:Emfourin
MKIVYRQSGGFAGLYRGCELDVGELPAAEAAEVERLLARGRGGSETPPPPSPSGARDLTSHEVRIEGDAGETLVSFDDAGVPAGAEALLRYLQKRSGPRPLP